jgi:phenylpropionate dioxygenase-like ring-hydroxylating dioxygenase large terminal subunit
MTAYLPIVLGQDTLQCLCHLPCNCINSWADFCNKFVSNIQSLSDKPTHPWDLKSVRQKNDESLCSFLKRFQTMRNRIPNITDVAMIEEFYQVSHDEVFVRAILQEAPTTIEQLFRKADAYI